MQLAGNTEQPARGGKRGQCGRPQWRAQIQWSGPCGGGPGGECPASGAGTLSSQYDVYAADIDLVDDTPPTVSNVGGPLVSGGTLSGQQTVSFNASDGQSGVYAGTLLVDGHVAISQILDSNGGACRNLGITSDGQRSFEHAQPCAPSVSASLTLETGLSAAGQHSLELIVEDAAGNQTIAYDSTITTSGPPNVGVNGGAISGRGTPNGEPCAGEALEVAVNSKRTPPVVQYGKPVTVRGVLHCGTVPIRDARIAVNTVGAPASAAIDTSVQTALDGSFTYKVPIGPDRTLSFGYTAYSNDPGPSATATATIAVRPKIRLRIRPERTSNGNTIHWSGTITGGPYPPQGVTLDVEVREGRRWRSSIRLSPGVGAAFTTATVSTTPPNPRPTRSELRYLTPAPRATRIPTAPVTQSTYTSGHEPRRPVDSRQRLGQ